MKKIIYLLASISIAGLIFIALYDKGSTIQTNQSKIDVYRTIYKDIINETKKIPDCLTVAENKEEAFSCSQGLRLSSQKLAQAMGNNNQIEIEGYGNDFIWNENIKREMIKEIEISKESMYEVEKCINSVNSVKKAEGCLISSNAI